MLKRSFIKQKLEDLKAEATRTEDEFYKKHVRSLMRAYEKEYEKAQAREEPQIGADGYSYNAPRTGKNQRRGYDFY